MRLAFLYAGQGAQTPGMGKDLYEENECFRRTIDICAKVCGDKPDLKKLMFSSSMEAFMP